MGEPGDQWLPRKRDVADLPRIYSHSPARALHRTFRQRNDECSHSFDDLPEEARNSSLFRLTLNQGIAELEGYIDDKVTNFAWTADTVVMYNGLVKMGKVQRIMESSFGLVNATYSIPSAQFKGVLDAIRNKALDLALELYAAAPEAGEATAGPSTNNVARDTIIQFITYNFPSADLSGSNNAFGSSEFAQAQAPSPSQEPEH